MIEQIDLSQGQELDAFVLSHPNCHFMQTTLWGRTKSDWLWHGLICRDENRQIRGTMAILQHNTHLFRSCMLYAPRGPIYDYGDRETLRRLLEAARALAAQTGAYVLRMDPMFPEEDQALLAQVQAMGFQVNRAGDYSLFQPRMCYVLDLNGLTPETVEERYHRSTRYNVHLAQRRGVEVRLGGEEDLDDFYRLMALTGRNSGFTPRSDAYYRNFFTSMAPAVRLYLAVRDGAAIAAAMAVFLGNRAWYMYSASDPEARRDYPNELLQWHMHCDAIRMGCRWFDFRGVEGYPTEENPKFGLHRFKQGFGAQFRAYAGQMDYICRRGIYRLADLYARSSFRL